MEYSLFVQPNFDVRLSPRESKRVIIRPKDFDIIVPDLTLYKAEVGVTRGENGEMIYARNFSERDTPGLSNTRLFLRERKASESLIEMIGEQEEPVEGVPKIKRSFMGFLLEKQTAQLQRQHEEELKDAAVNLGLE